MVVSWPAPSAWQSVGVSRHAGPAAPTFFSVSFRPASTAFLADSQPPNRKALAVYPVFLFYFVISWMILTFTP